MKNKKNNCEQLTHSPNVGDAKTVLGLTWELVMQSTLPLGWKEFNYLTIFTVSASSIFGSKHFLFQYGNDIIGKISRSREIIFNINP